MSIEMEIPAQVPLMPLSGCVLFPQALLPLHIFEERYRQMLSSVLRSHRMFAVSYLDSSAEKSEEREPFFAVSTLGMIRACQHNADGTANLVLQGLIRVQILRVIQDHPYRMIEIAPVLCTASEPESLALQRAVTTKLIRQQQKITGAHPERFLSFLTSLDDPDAFIDLSSYALCPDLDLKQELLETFDTNERFQLFCHWLRGENRRARLFRKMQGGIKEEDIGLN